MERAQCGLCVDMSSRDAIADGLPQLYQAQAVAEGMSANGKRFVNKDRNWKKQERKLLNFDELVLKRKFA